jgi:isoleucyl-tRNA synthetase
LHRLHGLILQATRSYEEFDFHAVYHRLNEFCANDLSAFYLDVLKDTLYCDAAGSPSRRSAQTALWHLADTLTRLMAVVIAHTAEEAWQKLPHLPEQDSRSVHLTDWPQPSPEWADENLAWRWQRLLLVRGEVQKALEVARQVGTISQPLEASVTIRAPHQEHEILRSIESELASLLIVSAANVEKSQEATSTSGAGMPEGWWQSESLKELSVYVERARGKRCARCWLTRPDVGDVGLCQRCISVVEGRASTDVRHG